MIATIRRQGIGRSFLQRHAALLTIAGALVASIPPISLSHAAEPPAADPVLAEATDLAGIAMFLDSASPGMLLAVVRGDRSIIAATAKLRGATGKRPTAAACCA